MYFKPIFSQQRCLCRLGAVDRSCYINNRIVAVYQGDIKLCFKQDEV